MTFFNFSTGNETFEGGADDDSFRISRPSDTDAVYTVTANGGGGNDSLIHIRLNPINIIFVGGEGNDRAETLFGNAVSTFQFDMGAGDDLVIIGGQKRAGSGQYDLTLGDGSDRLGHECGL